MSAVHEIPSYWRPWMSEMIDLKKERNFFETRVTEHQTGALSRDA